MQKCLEGVLGRGAQKRGEALLDIVSEGDHDDPLADSIEKELQKLAEVPTGPKKSVSPLRKPSLNASCL